MDRRQFAKTLGIGAMGLALSRTALSSADEKPQVSITIDDFNVFGASRELAEKRNHALLDALRSHSNLKAAAFPSGRNIDSELGKSLVREWGERGHMIGNHTYSHWFYPNRSFEEFSEDVLRLEPLIKDMPGFTKRFRFPGLKEGDTVERRDKMRAFLKEHGYRMGYVTIDASDWYIDQRLRARLGVNPKVDVSAYRDYYLNHLWDRANFYDGLARKALGRRVLHTLLIHHTVLNELFLSDVLDMFQSKGWRLINAEDAFRDPVFSAEPNILPAGESIIWSLAKESGKFNGLLRYPGEDDIYEKPKMDKLGL
ncbi:MAG: polysaccharide deacetylase family protein [Acidobacteriota bacterium]|nr:polysaccharide deacetylase family protein [Acidobacteriota bacterium]